MAKITFYRQARQDGGIRTGVDVDDATALERFEAGSTYDDPALLWYVDVRCQGKSLPNQAEGARKWLISNGALIRQSLKALADEVSTGMDSDVWPLRRPVLHAPRGARIELACSATRRVDGREIAAVLRDIAVRWDRRLKNLRSDSVEHEITRS